MGRYIDEDYLLTHKVSGQLRLNNGGILEGDFVTGYDIAHAPAVESKPETMNEQRKKLGLPEINNDSEALKFQQLGEKAVQGFEDSLTSDNPVGNDSVNHPSYYTYGNIEPIDFIIDKKLGFCLGNAVKYISRAGKKDPSKLVEDLEKAIWYIRYYINTVAANE